MYESTAFTHLGASVSQVRDAWVQARIQEVMVSLHAVLPVVQSWLLESGVVLLSQWGDIRVQGGRRGSRTENTPEICAGIPKTILGGRQSYARFTRIHALGGEKKRVLEVKESSEMLGFWYAQRKRPWHHGLPANKPGSWFLSNKEHPPEYGVL